MLIKYGKRFSWKTKSRRDILGHKGQWIEQEVGAMKYLGTLITTLGYVEQITSHTCGAAMICDFPSRVGCIVLQFVMFYFTVAKPVPFALGIVGRFRYSTADISQSLLESDDNIG